MTTVEDLLSHFRDKYSHINPIMITAPTQRCGTTLLQRAINSGGEAVIYGENFMLLEMMAYNLGTSIYDLENKTTICRSTSEAFWGGKKNVDATALFPDFEEYINVLFDSYFAIFEQYDSYTKSNGVQNWGFKHQPRDINGFINTLIFLPNVRIVFVYRDLIAVAKSMRARWPETMDSDDKLIAFGHRWAQNTAKIIKSKKQKMILKYENLIENPEEFIPEIEEFIGMKVDKNEFTNKVNSHFIGKDIEKQSVNEAKTSGNYIKPAQISDVERDLLLTHANDIYKQLGY